MTKQTGALVPVRAQRVQIREGGGRRTSLEVLVMPRFVETLQDPQVRSPECILTQTKRIVGALNYIHEHNRVHMDVKAGNIFVSDSGDWYLGDFGSCVPLDSPIVSYTEMLYWDILPPPSPARFEYDWAMLGVCVLIQAKISLHKNERELVSFDLGELTVVGASERKRVSKEKVFQVTSTVEDEALRTLIGRLLNHKDALFK